MNEMQKKEQKNELPGRLSLEKERLLNTSYFRCEWSM